MCEIFQGPKKDAGSVRKKAESDRQAAICALQLQYEAIENIPLIARFLGDMRDDIIAKVIPRLLSENFAAKPVSYQVDFDIDTTIGAKLKVYVTKALRADWFSVNDRVGWVDQNPMLAISEMVESKSKKLPDYISAAGPDMRLLLVANRIHNSGKMTLENREVIDKHGFKVIYFYSCPHDIYVLP